MRLMRHVPGTGNHRFDGTLNIALQAIGMDMRPYHLIGIARHDVHRAGNVGVAWGFSDDEPSQAMNILGIGLKGARSQHQPRP